MIVFGSGPIRIGQGIEFDYASVHCVWALKEGRVRGGHCQQQPGDRVHRLSTPADRLYFEPLTPEDVMSVIHTEKPYGVVVAFGGQTAIKLTKFLSCRRPGPWAPRRTASTCGEDRERFDELLEPCGIARPSGSPS